MKSVSVTSLQSMKRAGERIAALTAYDASFAAMLDTCGVDVVLVGDSLGMVIQGHETTVPVTVDQMIYHCRAVASRCRRPLLMVDMPFMSYATIGDALRNGARLMQEGGGHMVKLEGTANQAETVRQLVACGVPVCGHLGLRPQFVHKLGGYRVQGRDADAARQLLDDALSLQDAGADLLILEAVPAAVAKTASEALRIPVIGIGAGRNCDGQVLVLYDMLGITPGRRPRFSKDFMAEAGAMDKAVTSYVQAVKQGTFPGDEQILA